MLPLSIGPQVLSELVRANVRDVARAGAMEEIVRSLGEFSASCDRLYRTPIPTTYSSHTR